MISCKEFSTQVKNIVKDIIKNQGYQPTLAIISNNRPEGERYIRNKVKVAEEVGIKATVYDLKDKSLDEIKIFIASVKEDALILQLPFKSPIIDESLISLIPVGKDADGLVNNLIPATAAGILHYLNINGLVDGSSITVIGRSNLVGKPLVQELLKSDATVTLCHSQTQNLKDHVKVADVVVCAVGKPSFLTKDFFNPDKNYVVVDVGINIVNGKMCGDVDKEVYDLPNVYTTPVPGGVGLLTTSYLMCNILDLYMNKR